MTLTIHPRSEWTDRPIPPSRPLMNVAFGRVHHEGGRPRGVPSNKPATLREIEAGVLNKGYVAIDYSYMVFQDGDVWEGRGLTYEDAATLHHNRDSVSVCGVGNFQIEAASDELVRGIAGAFQYASATGWLTPRAAIFPHSATYETACPGRFLYERMGDIVAVYLNDITPKRQEDGEAMRLIQANDGDPRVYITDMCDPKRWVSGDEVQHVILPYFVECGWSGTVQVVSRDVCDRIRTVGYEPKWKK